MAAVKYHPESTSLRERLHELGVQVVVYNLPGGLEVARNERVILAVRLITTLVRLPAAMATVVEKKARPQATRPM